MDTIPSIQDWLTKTPLYREYKYSIKSADAKALTPDSAIDKQIQTIEEMKATQNRFIMIRALLRPTTSIDMYCPSCKSTSTFQPYIRPVSSTTTDEIKNGTHYSSYSCGRTDCGQEHQYYFILNEMNLTKIGQYPSLADLLSPNLKKYSKVLSKGLLSEWNKAIGLNAHGVGVGSFVYLRRILEDIVQETANHAELDDSTFDMSQYKKERWPEKVKLLSKYLPKFLVDHAKIYSILSIGVHELSDDKCLAYFEAMHTSIEVICDQRLKQKKEKDKEQQASKSIASILGEIK